MTENLHDAIERVWRDRWVGTRSAKTLLSQVEKAVKTLEDISQTPLYVHEVKNFLQLGVAKWNTEGLSQATINKRLNCLAALGADVGGYRKKPKPQLKWWLTPADAEKLIAHLEANTPEDRISNELVFMMYLGFVSRVGLRTEEALALTWGDLTLTRQPTVNVKGTKTATSQACLPLSMLVARMLYSYKEAMQQYCGVLDTDEVFPMTYTELNNFWQGCRKVLDAEHIPTATLKALRRTAARYLHVDCNMPLAMVQQYLRHENVQTTMEYLRLTGGYGTEEMRRFMQ